MRSVPQVLLTLVAGQACDVVDLCECGFERCGQTAPFRVERLDGHVIGHACQDHVARVVFMEFDPPDGDV